MSDRALAAAGWVLIGIAALWAGYLLLWVNDIAFSPGDTQWSDPTRAVRLFVAAGLGLFASGFLTVRLLSDGASKAVRIGFVLAVIITVLAATSLGFVAVYRIQ